MGARWSAFIAGSGTGGTMMGVHRYIEKASLAVETVLMTPLESAHEHGIQGVNDGKDFLLNKSIIDYEFKVSTREAIDRSLRLSKENGLLVGISSGANIVAAEKYIAKKKPNGDVVTLICDRGERYNSIFNKYVQVQSRRSGKILY
jgi:cysteine synthase A